MVGMKVPSTFVGSANDDQGLDVAQLATDGRFTFVDGLRSLFSAPRDGEAVYEKGIEVLQKASLEIIEGAIMKILATRSAEKSKIMLVLDGLDLLLAATAISAQEVLDMVSELQEVSRGDVTNLC